MEHWQQVKELFERARELPDGERRSYLEAHCPDAPELLDEVLSLLEHGSEDFLEDPTHLRSRPRSEDADGRPARVGPYEIRDELGSGGMGVVYLAEQQEPVRRLVALKVIQQGMATRQVLARFDAERQALALMNHPHIARVYDAGATEQGNPYFVMEYVEGLPIAEHCDRERLGKRRRLELFVDVCEGLQHAHQKGIIHRDIKSSNVLVALQDDRAVPKVIDFGIAKATDQRLGEATVRTELGQIIGTPEYMSPEQAEMTGQDIDTRTDVYSLGVLLYLLLVGDFPFSSEELRSVSLDELRRKIREEEPPRPSTRFTGLGPRRESISRERTTDPGSFVRELRGDLDWIVMKALEKDRARRYSSAAELAADVRRHLDDEPVEARPPTAGYRVRKFVRRHRLGVSAAAVVATALVLGVVGTTAGMLRALRAERLATTEAATNARVVGYLESIFNNADPDSELRDVSALQILETGTQMIDSLDDEPEVQAKLAKTIGGILTNRRDWNAARPLLQKSLEINRALHPGTHLEVMDALNELGQLETIRRNDEEARALYEEALAMGEGLYGPGDTRVATVMKNLADVLARQEEYGEARRLHERALAIRERANPQSQEVARSLAGLANVLVKLEDYDGAIPILERSLEMRRATEESGRRVALGYQFLAEAQDMAGRYDDALPNYRAALENFERAYDSPHDHTRNAAFGLAGVLARLERWNDAEPYYRRALAIDESLYGQEHEYLVETLEAYAACSRQLGRDAEAERLAARADRTRQRVAAAQD